MFDRTVDAEKMNTKQSRDNVHAFLTMFTKTNRPKKIRVNKATEFTGGFEKLRKSEGKQFYSTMSETMAAFAERTRRPLKIYITVTWKTMETSTFTK